MKTENLNIAIFPIGSIIKFKKKHLKRSDGSNEYFKLIWTLCRQKSVDRITILQKSDWNKLTDIEKIEIDPRGVIYDVYSEHNLKTPSTPTEKTGPHTKEVVYYLWEALKDQPIPDMGIGFPAQGFSMNNIPMFMYGVKNPDKLSNTLNMTTRYSGPIVHYINKAKFPWYLCVTDPRYIKPLLKRRDVANHPKELLSQYNSEIQFQSLEYYDEEATAKETIKDIKTTYTGIEKLNLINEPIIPPDNKERTNKFAVVAMQSSYGKSDKKDYRFNVLKDWVFKYDDQKETKVFGKWAEYFTDQYPQFKGFLPSDEIDEIFENTRYTLVIPIRPDWVTSKYAEMLRVGVVPFLHKDYDTQYNLIPKDHFIRINTPEDFYEKMKYLDENPKKRILLVKNLQGKFLSGVKRGKFLLNIINDANERNNIQVNIPYKWDDTIIRKSKTKALF